MPVSHKSKSLKKSRKNNRSNKTKNNIKKMKGGGSEAFIIIVNKNNVREVVSAHDYQANALEENIINDKHISKHQFKEVNHCYYTINGTNKFRIVKQDTRYVGFDKLDVKYLNDLYVFIREDGTTTYISQNNQALQAIIDNNYS